MSTRFTSVSEAASRLGISKITCYRHVESGLLPSTKLGNRRLIPEAALERLESQALATVPVGQGA